MQLDVFRRDSARARRIGLKKITYFLRSACPMFALAVVPVALASDLGFGSMPEALRSIGRRGKLRVTFPGDEAHYLVTVAEGTGVNGTSKDGVIVRVAHGIFARHGIAWEATPIANNFTGSDYVACIHDIALNNTDICLAAFFDTAERRTIADFTGPVSSSSFMAVVWRVQPDSWPSISEMLRSPFTPFDDDVWMWLLVTISYVGLIRWAIQIANDDADGDPDTFADAAPEHAANPAAAPAGGAEGAAERQSPSVESQPGATTIDAIAVIGEANKSNAEIVGREIVRRAGASMRAIRRKTPREDTQRSLEAQGACYAALSDLVYHQANTFQGALGDWRGDDPRNLSQWVLLIGATFSFLVVLTFYTAQVTQNMIFDSGHPTEVRSIEEGIDRGLTICIPEGSGIKPAFEGSFPQVAAADLIVLVHYSMLLPSMDLGLCDIVLMSTSDWLVNVRASDSAHTHLPCTRVRAECPCCRRAHVSSAPARHSSKWRDPGAMPTCRTLLTCLSFARPLCVYN